MARLTVISFLLMLTVLSGCQTTQPSRALQLPPASLENRQLQTRRFADTTEDTLLAACAGVLQDLGFNLDESETELGVIVASKRRSAVDPGTGRLMQLLSILADIDIPVDKEQRIRVSLVSWPTSDVEGSFFVRVTFQRVVWNTDNEVSRREELNDPQIYQQFFERLSKSVFLEAHAI